MPGMRRSASTCEPPAKPVPMTATLTATLLADHGALVHAALGRLAHEREVHAAHLGAGVVEPLDALDRTLAPPDELVAMPGVVVDELADPASGELDVCELVGLEVVRQLGDPVEPSLGRLLTPDSERLHAV